VRSHDGREGVFALARRADVPEGATEQPTLVFEKDGFRYALAQVLDPGAGFGLRLVDTRRRPSEEKAEDSGS
jgi:hypothetical protein